MKILLVASSSLEIQPFLDHLEKEWERVSFSEYKRGEVHIYPLVAGHMPVFMTYAICKFANIKDIDRVILAGLGVATTRIFEIGQTVNVGRDIFGDVGIEESDGSFKDVFDIKMQDPNMYPFFKGQIFNEDIVNPLKYHVAKSITVNKFPGTFENIEAINKKYHAELITSNGGAFSYTCKMLDVKYLQIRTVYRYLEPSTIPNRDMDLAVNNLNAELIKLIDVLPHMKKKVNFLY